MDLLNQQLLNKGTAFTDKERTECGLDGLLPPHMETLDEQVVRAYEAYQKKTTTWSGIFICALCKTRTRSSFTDFFSTTLKK
jgi:hypothetical protein